MTALPNKKLRLIQGIETKAEYGIDPAIDVKKVQEVPAESVMRLLPNFSVSFNNLVMVLKW
jgi:hypothetical protein